MKRMDAPPLYPGPVSLDFAYSISDGGDRVQVAVEITHTSCWSVSQVTMLGERPLVGGHRMRRDAEWRTLVLYGHERNSGQYASIRKHARREFAFCRAYHVPQAAIVL